MSLIDFDDAPFQQTHWKLSLGATTGYISDGYTLGVVGSCPSERSSSAVSLAEQTYGHDQPVDQSPPSARGYCGYCCVTTFSR